MTVYDIHCDVHKKKKLYRCTYISIIYNIKRLETISLNNDKPIQYYKTLQL